MSFQYAQEKIKFEKHWSELRIQYEQAGMSQDAIEELHDFDWQWFKSRRRYINSLRELPEGTSLEDLPSCGVDPTGGEPPQHYGMSASSPNRYSWLDEIEDVALLQKLMLLERDDIELLTSMIFEGHSQREIAQRNGCSERSVSRQFQRIIKIFQKSV